MDVIEEPLVEYPVVGDTGIRLDVNNLINLTEIEKLGLYKLIYAYKLIKKTPLSRDGATYQNQLVTKILDSIGMITN